MNPHWVQRPCDWVVMKLCSDWSKVIACREFGNALFNSRAILLKLHEIQILVPFSKLQALNCLMSHCQSGQWTWFTSGIPTVTSLPSNMQNALIFVLFVSLTRTMNSDMLCCLKMRQPPKKQTQCLYAQGPSLATISQWIIMFSLANMTKHSQTGWHCPKQSRPSMTMHYSKNVMNCINPKLSQYSFLMTFAVHRFILTLAWHWPVP